VLLLKEFKVQQIKGDAITRKHTVLKH